MNRLVVILLIFAYTFGCKQQTVPSVHGEVTLECMNQVDESNDEVKVILSMKPSVFEYDNKVKVDVVRPDDPSPGTQLNKLDVRYHMPGGAMEGCGGVNTSTATISVSENAAENVIIQLTSRYPVTFAMIREDERPFYGPVRLLPDTEALIEWPREIENRNTTND